MPYRMTYDYFTKNTAGHHLKVLHDDGLYRHLRMCSHYDDGAPTSVWYWDIVTWPGSLAIRGDVADGYIFTRDTDMLQFFTARPSEHHHGDEPQIDMHYWAQKLASEHRSTATVYSSKTFLDSVQDALSNDSTDPDDLMSAARQDMLFSLDEQAFAQLPDQDDPGYEQALNALLNPIADELLDDARTASETEEQARQWLYEHNSLFPDAAGEWDLSEFDPQFRIACWAIDKTVRAYQERTDQN